MPKVKCKFHDDSTASMHVYEEEGRYYCYGCGAHGNTDDVGIPTNPQGYRKVPADVHSDLIKIAVLPTDYVRGLKLPVSSDSYFIVWDNYYLRRKFNPGPEEPKYVGPGGVPRPLLQKLGGHKTLLLVEGEMNALSCMETDIPADIVCAGSANGFYAKSNKQYLRVWASYDTILLMLDNDKAGAIGAIMTKAALQARGASNVIIWLTDNDANDILVKDGKSELGRQIKEKLGLSAGVPSNQGALQTPRSATAINAPGRGEESGPDALHDQTG